MILILKVLKVLHTMIRTILNMNLIPIPMPVRIIIERKFVVLDDDDGDNHEGSPITNEDSNDSLDIPSTLSKWSKTNYQVKKLVMLDGITTRSNAKKKMRLI